ncbi:hypothetical protein [Acetobacter malorum]|uniref:hypothetical protein n=1 Tax=Acetobacter malorum TaxID=178901 RepID=UPI001178096D|nr:hypothetical protein [Acetobacter malorum]
MKRYKFLLFFLLFSISYSAWGENTEIIEHTSPSYVDLQNYDLKFDGSKNDEKILNSIFSSIESGSIISIPYIKNSELPSYYSPLGTDKKSSLLINYNNKLRNISALDSIDGFPKIQFDANGVLSYKKSVSKNDKSIVPNIWIEYYNNHTSPKGERPDHINFVLMGHTGESSGYQANNSHSSGDMINLQNVLRSMGRSGWSAFDINNYNFMYRYGTNWVWNSVQQLDELGNTPIHTTDKAFNDSSDTEEWVQEWDLSGFGPEAACSFYNPSCGYRTGFLFNAWLSGGGYNEKWKPKHQYKLGDAINVKLNEKYYSFIVIKPGISNDLEPIWNKSYDVVGCDPLYPNSNTAHATLIDAGNHLLETCQGYKNKHDNPLHDGSVEWSFNSPMGLEISNFIRLSQSKSQDIKYGTFLSSDATFYNAIIDFSEAHFYSALAYNVFIRSKPDTYIDFSAQATKETQNIHLLGYDSENKSLSYKFNNISIFKIKDEGGVVLKHMTRKNIKNLKGSEEGEIIFDITDHVPVIFLNGRWKKMSFSDDM